MLEIVRNIALGISLAAPIGPVNVEVIRRGLGRGFLPAFSLSRGAASADTTYLLLIFFGLSSVINISVVKTLIWTFGAMVLIYLGYQSVKESLGNVVLDRAGTRSGRNSYVAGYIITISNPMTIVWWVGVFGAVLGSSIRDASRVAALSNSLTIIVGVIAWFFTLSLLLHWGRRFINETAMRYISLIAGLVLIGFGVHFGYRAIASRI